jgi:hypothetical protein
MTDRATIIAEAKKWLGATWHHQACVPYIAADCGQILIDIYTKCGFVSEPPDVGYYPRDWALHKDDERYLAVVESYTHQVDAPLPGDIAVWKVGRTFSHGAVVLDWPWIIHADMNIGVVKADASQGDLATREVRFYSVIESQT